MSEIAFVVENAPEGGFSAHAVGESIHPQAESEDELHDRVRDAVRCHFEDGGPDSKILSLELSPAASNLRPSLTQWITIVAADDKAFHEPLGQHIAQVPKPKQRFVMEMLDTVL